MHTNVGSPAAPKAILSERLLTLHYTQGRLGGWLKHLRLMQGGKGGRGGGDGDGGSGFNWREWTAKFLRDLGGGAKSVAQTIAALLLMLSVFYAASFVRPLSAAALNAVRYILRLDGRGARRVRVFPMLDAAPCFTMHGILMLTTNPLKWWLLMTACAASRIILTPGVPWEKN